MSKIAIFLHMGNHNLWDEIKTYIDKVYEIYNDTYLYISYQKYSEKFEDIKKIYKNIKFIKCKLGCDIGGQLLFFDYLYKNNINHEYILKLHTKTKDKWRYELIDPICSDIKKLIQTFEKNKNIGMIASKKWILPIDDLNHPIIKYKCKKWDLYYDLDDKTISFVGGTIFWLRWSVFKDFAKAKNIDFKHEYYQLENGYNTNDKPTITHSWERLFGIIIKNHNYEILPINDFSIINPYIIIIIIIILIIIIIIIYINF